MGTIGTCEEQSSEDLSPGRACGRVGAWAGEQML